MYDEIHKFMRKDTCKVVPRKSVTDHNVITLTWSFKCKRKSDWTFGIFKERYCVRGYLHKRLSPEPKELYSPVVQWSTVRLMLIIQYILGLKIQSVDFKNAFDQADIPGGEPVLIELTRIYYSDRGKYDVVISLR